MSAPSHFVRGDGCDTGDPDGATEAPMASDGTDGRGETGGDGDRFARVR